MKQGQFIRIFLITLCTMVLSLVLSCGEPDPSGEYLESIVVYPHAAIIPPGSSMQLMVNGVYSGGSESDISSLVIWRSSNEYVATVNPSGLLSGLRAGSVVIYAAMGPARGQALINVGTPSSVVLVSLAVTPASTSILNGGTQQFIATGTYSNSASVDLTDLVDWTSSNTSVATVETSGNTGLANGVSAGITTITAVEPTSGISSLSTGGSAVLNVVEVDLLSIAVAPASNSVALGLQQRFTALGSFSDGNDYDITGLVDWTISNAPVALVNNTGDKGLVNSLATGMTNVVATDPASGISSDDTAESGVLTVTDKVIVELTVLPVTDTVVVGDTRQFNASATYSDGSIAGVKWAVTWTSSDTGVAMVNDTTVKGLVTAVDAGVCNVIITHPDTGVSSEDSGGSATVTVPVPIWVMTLEETDDGLDGFVNSTVAYEEYDILGNSIKNTVYDNDNNGVDDVIYSYVYNAAGDLMEVYYDMDASGTADMSYYYFYNAAGQKALVQSEYTGDSTIDAEYTYFYNAAGFLAIHNSDTGADGSIEGQTYYYHGATGLLYVKERDDGIDGVFEQIDFYSYGPDGNTTYHGIDTTNDRVADSTKDYTYDVSGELIRYEHDTDADGTPEIIETYTYTYDSYGNRTTRTTDNGGDGSADSKTTYTWVAQ